MTKSTTSTTNGLGRIFGVPLVLGVAAGFGLLSALIGDGTWDVLSWFTLALPLGVAGYYWRRR